jgi:hypothetical protein
MARSGEPGGLSNFLSLRPPLVRTGPRSRTSSRGALIGILAEKYEWWGRARDQAIVEITSVAWATAPAPINPTAAAARTAATPPGGSRTK